MLDRDLYNKLTDVARNYMNTDENMKSRIYDFIYQINEFIIDFEDEDPDNRLKFINENSCIGFLENWIEICSDIYENAILCNLNERSGFYGEFAILIVENYKSHIFYRQNCKRMDT